MLRRHDFEGVERQVSYSGREDSDALLLIVTETESASKIHITKNSK